MIYKTIIVDDEDKALERMSKLCNRSDMIEVIGVFTKPLDAITFAQTHEVDLAFLDIEMPNMSGLELAEILQENQPKMDVVFVTAFDKYALDAFQVNAVGYLLKPIDYNDLEQQLCNLTKKKKLTQIPYNKRCLRVQCMGGFFVFKDRDMKEIIKWRTTKAEELLAILIHHRGQALTKDRIIDLLWPEMEYDRASKNLHAISYYIRDAFHSLGYEDVFIRSKGQYQLKVERLDIDIVMIESLISCIPLKSIADEKIIAILKLAKGKYFEGKDYSWAMATDTWIQNKIDEVALIHAERLRNIQRTEEAIEVLMDIIKRNACNENAFKMLIQIYLYQGNLNKAQQWYKTYETNLREELDVEPDEDIKKLIL